MIACEIEHVVKEFGTTKALRGVSFTAGAGELCGVVGPNGAGKSTLLRVLTGHLRASAGSARVLGADPSTMPEELRRSVGFVPQEVSLFEYLTGREYVDLTLSLYGRGGDADEDRVASVGTSLELSGALDRQVRYYSPGMRKKLVFVPLLVAAPRLLLLDEPFDSIDTSAVLFLQACLRALVAAGGTVVLCTHLLEVAASVCSRILILKDGELASSLSAPPNAGISLDELRTSYHSHVGHPDTTGLDWLTAGSHAWR